MSAGRENLENLARMFACQTFSDLVKEELFVTPLAGAAGLRHYIFRVDGPSDVLPLTIRVNAILDDEERIKSEREFFALK